MSWAAVAGAAVGVVGNQLGKKGGTTATTQNSAPWEGSAPYLLKGNARASGMLDQTQFPSNMVGQEANNLAASTLRGDYLNSNPFLNDSVSQAMGMARSQINSQFGGGSNYGSSAHQEWLSKGLMNAALPQLSQNYENERGRQFAALSQAPALSGMDYQQAFAPWDMLGRYQDIVGNQGGGSSSTQNPYFTNPVNSAMGGALLGNQLYNSYTKNNPSVDTSWLGAMGSGGGYY